MRFRVHCYRFDACSWYELKSAYFVLFCSFFFVSVSFSVNQPLVAANVHLKLNLNRLNQLIYNLYP